jgi:uncharacterized protein YndB with AHSA1/START domain
VETATTLVPAPLRTCWQLFTDPRTLTAWIPGLRRAQVIATKERGLPAEIHFELVSSHVYTLVYTYDVEQFEVRWEPKLGRRDGVSGFAKFEATDDGTRMTYGLLHGEARSEAERAMNDPNDVVAAFVAFVARGAR